MNQKTNHLSSLIFFIEVIIYINNTQTHKIGYAQIDVAHSLHLFNQLSASTHSPSPMSTIRLGTITSFATEECLICYIKILVTNFHNNFRVLVRTQIDGGVVVLTKHDNAQTAL